LLQKPAHADTYEILALGYDTDFDIYGIDGSGDVILTNGAGGEPCVADPGNPLFYVPCYYTFVNGIAVSHSTTAPTITDNIGPAGPGCPAIPSYTPASLISFDLCANGHELYGVDGLYVNPNTGLVGGRGVYDGPDPTLDSVVGIYPENIGPDRAMENSYGDLVFEDVGEEEIIEAYDVTAHAPEPTTLALLSTGALATAAAIRKRRRKM